MPTRTDTREQFLADIITAAVEGGTGYWASVAAYRWVDRAPADVYAVLVDQEDEEAQAKRRRLRVGHGGHLTIAAALATEGSGTYRLDIDAIARGIGRIVRGEAAVHAGLKQLIVDASRENDAGYLDAEAADVIAQAALLGEVRYG